MEGIFVKKSLIVIFIAIFSLASLTGCGNNPSKEIAVVSREEGSGTRGAFIELFGIEQKNQDGNKVDNTTEDADITNSTSVMMTSIASNINAIGYVSLGSLNNSVKAVMIDGAEATVKNIKAGKYKIARPFNIAIKKEASGAAKAFIEFILSSEGQAVIETNGYISAVNGKPFSSKSVSGKVVVAGSSSVTPVMEKLKEAYEVINRNAEIEIQQSDSTTGMNSAMEGICDIGMASRELKDSEIAAGLATTIIAMDGIAVIVNNKSSVKELSSDQVRAIFIGELTNWSEIDG
jgi:phosphate transport system substrate-binding protein